MGGKIDKGPGSGWSPGIPQPKAAGSYGSTSGMLNYPPSAPEQTPGKLSSTVPGQYDVNGPMGT